MSMLYRAVPRGARTLIQKIDTDPPPGIPVEQNAGDRVIVYPQAMFTYRGPAFDDAGTINDVLLRGLPISLIGWGISQVPYTIYTPIQMPTEGIIRGTKGGKHLTSGSVIQAAPTFAGTAMIVFADNSHEQLLSRLSLDGSLMPAGTADGIHAASQVVQYVELDSILAFGAGLTSGLNLAAGGGSNPDGWRIGKFVVRGTTGTGILISQATDVNAGILQAIGCGGHGITLAGSQNSKFGDIRADFNGDFGVQISGAWSTGSGSGGMSIVSLSTDRNAQHGVFFNAPTGNSPVAIGTLMTRRDGSSNPASGFAGVRVNNCGLPVSISNWTNFPGVADDGTGNASPQYALNLSGANTLVLVTSAMLQAITAGINGAGGSYRNVWTSVGPTGAPGPWTLTPDTA